MIDLIGKLRDDFAVARVVQRLQRLIEDRRILEGVNVPSKLAKDLLKKNPESRKFDAAEYLTNPKRITAFLEIAIEEADGDTAAILQALNTAARARNMAELARETGLTRQGLYKALAPEGNPSFDTVQKLLRSFGLTLSSKPAA